MPKYMCDYWLLSRRQCRSSGVVLAEDEHGASFRFCSRHWPWAQTGHAGAYGRLRFVSRGS